jgi:CheY-like chemotaxis protein
LIELEQAQQPGRASAPAAARVTPLRVLVVEDNADMAEMLSELLAITGHQVVALASNGRQGVERAFALRPDVLLCDIGLPGELDGLDVARIIRAQSGPLAPHLIAVTGYGSADYRKRAKDAGFDYCLIKPVSLDRLQTHLQRAACELGQPSYVG